MYFAPGDVHTANSKGAHIMMSCIVGGEHFVEVSTILSETLRIALLWKHMDTAKNVLQQIRVRTFNKLLFFSGSHTCRMMSFFH